MVYNAKYQIRQASQYIQENKGQDLGKIKITDSHIVNT